MRCEFSLWIGKLLWRRAWLRSLVGYSPWGHTEWDVTEWLDAHPFERLYFSLVAQGLRICQQCQRCRRLWFNFCVRNIPWGRKRLRTPIFFFFFQTFKLINVNLHFKLCTCWISKNSQWSTASSKGQGFWGWVLIWFPCWKISLLNFLCISFLKIFLFLIN